MSLNINKGNKKRVVVIGGGFGGLQVVKKLRRSGFQVILIDKNNYHQFPPLIYQVASAGIEASSISFPFRRMFKSSDNVFFRMAELRGIFPDKHLVQTSIGKVEYDYLVLASGATTNYFGNKNVEAEAMPMKTVAEAMGLQNALLSNIERAITSSDAIERQELLNVVIVGGGATGVEVAGVMAEMKSVILPRDYPDLDASLVNIYLIEGGNRLLPAFSDDSSAAVERYLRNMGVNVLLNKMVVDFKDHKVLLADGSSIATRTFIWVSGIAGQKVGNLDASHIGRGGRIKVNLFNQLEGLDNVFCIGDQCIMQGDEKYINGHPQVAQVAIQQGNNLANNLKRIEKGKPMKPFAYRNLGSMATVGRNKAVAEFSSFRMKGFMAWLMWLVVHLRSILGVRNKILVLLNWMWNYFTYNQSLRIIFYPTKVKEVQEREEKQAVTHLGDDLLRSGK